MVIAKKNENLIIEAVTIALLSAAITTIVIETINRNKPESKTQK